MPTAATAADHSHGGDSRTISISLLITLPIDTQVSPLLPATVAGDRPNEAAGEHENDDGVRVEEKAVFNSFSFEEYAWRVYEDRCFHLKDPLDRYRI